MSKKIKFVTVLSLIILLISTTVSTVFAQDPTQEKIPVPPMKKIFARVAEILGIEEQKLLDAFAQARRELAEEIFQARLDKLVEQGRLTEEQAKQIKDWWSQRPHFLGPGLGLMKPNFDSGLRWGKGRFPKVPKLPQPKK